MDVKPVDEMGFAELKKGIADLTRTVPPSFQNWDVMKAREFKKAVAKANSSAEGGKEHIMRPALKVLRGFWQ